MTDEETDIIIGFSVPNLPGEQRQTSFLTGIGIIKYTMPISVNAF